MAGHGSRIALLTCRELPEPDPDEAPIVTALTADGHRVTVLAWDAPGEPPGAFDLCLIRSTWNYHTCLPVFLAFLDGVAAVTRLVNPLGAVRWNAHKRYLQVLADAGLAVTPTLWFGRREPVDEQRIARQGWDDVVIKPAVSAASFATRRFRAHERPAARRFLRALAAERDVMVQPYVPAVEAGGERALVWIDGGLTHAVAKQPRFAGGEESVSAPMAPDEVERAFVAQTFAALPPAIREGLLYARVDVFREASGALMLSELELIEPSLFLGDHPPATAALVRGVNRVLRQRS